MVNSISENAQPVFIVCLFISFWEHFSFKTMISFPYLQPVQNSSPPYPANVQPGSETPLEGEQELQLNKLHSANLHQFRGI